MKTNTILENLTGGGKYVAPVIEVFSTSVERGFAQSGGYTDSGFVPGLDESDEYGSF